VGKDPSHVAVTQSQDTRTFLPRDYLCVWRGDEEIACGIVLRVLPRGVLVKLDFQKARVGRGDRVHFAGGRYPAVASRADEAVIEDTRKTRPRRKYPFDLSLGGVGSLGYQLPFGHFQGMVATGWALGMQGQLLSRPIGNDRLKVFSGLLTLNYYGSTYYRGLWVQGGVGVAYFKGELASGSTQTATTLVGLATLGARFGLVGSLNIGLAGGAQYLAKPKGFNLAFEFPDWQPVAVVDIGWNF